MTNLENINNDCLLYLNKYLSTSDNKKLADTCKFYRILLLKEIRFNYTYTIEYVINKNFKNEIYEKLDKLRFSDTKIFLNGNNGILKFNNGTIEIESTNKKRRVIPKYI
jgi:hypothetical protein